MSNWSNLSRRAGRNDLPVILFYGYFRDGTLTDADLPEAIRSAWPAAEWPEQTLNADVWGTLYRRAGFVTDDEQATPTPENITVYRGAVQGRKRGMAWTDDLERATWFANRFGDYFGKPRVWKIDATADMLLGRFIGRGESEWVLDLSEVDNAAFERVS